MSLLKTFFIWTIAILVLIFSLLLITVVFAFIFAFPIMWLWNWLMPVLFCLSKINVFQALGLNVLCGLLFSVRTWNKNQNIDKKLSKNPSKIFKGWIKKNKQD